MTDILGLIRKNREARGWTEYQLAERSGLPQSTISSWYKKGMTPSFSSLEKICEAFGLTLSQFFADAEDRLALTPAQRTLLDKWSRLPPRPAELFAGTDGRDAGKITDQRRAAIAARRSFVCFWLPERTSTPALLCQGAWVSQYIFAPAGMWGSSMRRWSFSAPSSWWTALISIPQESMPIMGLGGRFVMATHVLPTSSSGS